MAQPAKTINLSNLPDDIFWHVLSFLDPRSLGRAARVSHFFRRCVHEAWPTLCRSRWPQLAYVPKLRDWSWNEVCRRALLPTPDQRCSQELDRGKVLVKTELKGEDVRSRTFFAYALGCQIELITGKRVVRVRDLERGGALRQLEGSLSEPIDERMHCGWCSVTQGLVIETGEGLDLIDVAAGCISRLPISLPYTFCYEVVLCEGSLLLNRGSNWECYSLIGETLPGISGHFTDRHIRGVHPYGAHALVHHESSQLFSYHAASSAFQTLGVGGAVAPSSALSLVNPRRGTLVAELFRLDQGGCSIEAVRVSGAVVALALYTPREERSSVLILNPFNPAPLQRIDYPSTEMDWKNVTVLGDHLILPGKTYTGGGCFVFTIGTMNVQTGVRVAHPIFMKAGPAYHWHQSPRLTGMMDRGGRTPRLAVWTKQSGPEDDYRASELFQFVPKPSDWENPPNRDATDYRRMPSEVFQLYDTHLWRVELERTLPILRSLRPER